jgi:hypothetical protein
MTRILLPALGLLALSVPAFASTAAQQAFAQLKKLEGTWEGRAGENGEMPVKVIYKVTGGGSALLETQFPGTGHEMVTVYHLDGDRLLMTHYCAAQNQPRMKLIPGKDPSVLQFDFVSGTNMKPKDVHMHNVKFRLQEKDHVVSEWTSYGNGKPVGTMKFDLSRKASS